MATNYNAQYQLASKLLEFISENNAIELETSQHINTMLQYIDLNIYAMDILRALIKSNKYVIFSNLFKRLINDEKIKKNINLNDLFEYALFAKNIQAVICIYASFKEINKELVTPSELNALLNHKDEFLFNIFLTITNEKKKHNYVFSTGARPEK